MLIATLLGEPWQWGMSYSLDAFVYLGTLKMKYHERNDDSRFIISLALVTILAGLVIVIPATNFYNLLGIF
jgi:hypothetical protein